MFNRFKTLSAGRRHCSVPLPFPKRRSARLHRPQLQPGGNSPKGSAGRNQTQARRADAADGPVHQESDSLAHCWCRRRPPTPRLRQRGPEQLDDDHDHDTTTTGPVEADSATDNGGVGVREFQGDDVGQVLRLLARQAKINMVVSEAVVGTVTMRLEDVTALQAVAIIVKAKGPLHG